MAENAYSHWLARLSRVPSLLSRDKRLMTEVWAQIYGYIGNTFMGTTKKQGGLNQRTVPRTLGEPVREQRGVVLVRVGDRPIRQACAVAARSEA